jgi:hypothetical protein
MVRWHDVNQVKEFVMKMRLLVVAALAALSSTAAFARYDGGDTWSELQPKASVTSTGPMTIATIGSLSGLRQTNPADYGTPAQANAADRIVRLDGGSKWVNVAYGETVDFVVDGQNGSARSFAWQFNVNPNLSHVDLSAVAPADFPDQGVRVFVTPDPEYSGD